MITAVLWVVLGFYGFTFGSILTCSVLLTGVSYIIGDLFILPKFGNTAATIADFGLAFIMLWLIGSYLFERPDGLGTASFIAAAVIGVGEFFFHRYMQREVLEDLLFPVIPNFNQRNMQTELGSEVDIKREEKKAREEGEKSNLTKEKDDFYNK